MTPAPEASRPSAWRAFLQSVLHFDATKLNPWLGARNALGVALPLFAGMALQRTGKPHALIDTEADRLTNAVNTLSEEVFRWSVTPAAA
jgi:hypothetical protein